MSILVCGDRNWTSYTAIYNSLLSLSEEWGSNIRIVSGGCVGADKMAVKAAKQLGYEFIEYPADWDTYGRAAGPIRNKQMITEEEIELVMAFHDNIASSKGTANMITQAKKQKIPVLLINSREEVVEI